MPQILPPHMLRRASTSSVSQSLAASTTQDQARTDIELMAWTSSLNDSTCLLPNHAAFTPTLHLQVETPGKPWMSLPLPLKPDPIHIFLVNPDNGTVSQTPRYTSIRPERSSGSCSLITTTEGDQETVLSSTTYRFGPGKPPVISLFPANEVGTLDTFPVTSISLFSHSQSFQTTIGTFAWRYASRSDRKSLDPDAHSILLLQRVSHIAVAGGGREESHQTIGVFIRSKRYRTAGSKASSAGNGGRLMLDLGIWDDDADEEGTSRTQVEVLAVTSLLVMLKKEVDRRRAAQIALMSSGGGGGGP